MKTRIVQIGNSRGIRIPKQALEETGLTGDVEIHIKKHSLVIHAVTRPRAGWAKAARELTDAGADELLDESTATAFDEDSWEW